MCVNYQYYLNVCESVTWKTNNNNLTIDFMSPTADIIGKVICNNFPLENSELAIYDTKKLSSLISICNGDLLLELEKQHKLISKLKISDLNFNLTYNGFDINGCSYDDTTDAITVYGPQNMGVQEEYFIIDTLFDTVFYLIYKLRMFP